MKKIITPFLLLVALSALNAQNTTPILYNELQNVVNPAAVGVEKGHTISVNLRNQWLQNANADNPQIQTFNTTHRITRSVNLGASVVNEKVFIQQQTALFADFSYTLPLNEKSQLYLGLKAGGNLFNIDGSRIKTYNTQYDPYLQGVSGLFQPNVGVGVYYQHQRFYAAVAVPNLLASDKAKVENQIVTSVSEQMNFYAQAGYNLPLTPDLTLSPRVQGYFQQNANYQLNTTAAVSYRNSIEAAIGYRTQSVAKAYVLLNIPKYYISVGYGFETNIDPELTANLRNVHEFMIKVHW